MILTGPEIHRAWKRREITIEPFSVDCLNPNSYNYRLGDKLLSLNDDGTCTALTAANGAYILRPGHVYLGSTVETVGSSHYVTMLNGRSSIGRLGMYLNLSADLGHVGAAHKWTLEITVIQPLRVHAGMKIGQATFWRIHGDAVLYQGAYAQRSVPTPSLYTIESMS